MLKKQNFNKTKESHDKICLCENVSLLQEIFEELIRSDVLEKRLTSKSYEEEVLEQNRRHKGEWLTYESAFYYYKKAKENEMKDYSLSGEKLYLWKELQRKYGVTELEATNILNGRCITDYVEKYQRIKNLVPLKVSKNKSLKENVYGK